MAFSSSAHVIAFAVLVLQLAAPASPPEDVPVYEFINGENRTTFLLRGCIRVVLTYPTTDGGHARATLNLSRGDAAVSQIYVNSTISGKSYLTTNLTWREGFTLSFVLAADLLSSHAHHWWVEAVGLFFSSSPLLPNSTINSTGHLRETYDKLFKTSLGQAYACSSVTFAVLGENVDASATVAIKEFELQGYVFSQNGAFSPDVNNCSPSWSVVRDLVIPVVVGVSLVVVGGVAITVYVIGMVVHRRRMRTRQYTVL